MDGLELPDPVARLVKSAAQHLDGRGELSRAFRLELHQAIEAASAPLHRKAGYYRRAKWALAAAVKTLPVWRAVARGNDAAERLLSKAVEGLAGRLPLERLRADVESVEHELVEAGNSDDALQLPSAAAFACCGAASVVVYDFEMESLQKDPKELEPSEWEPCLFSSIAFAGGAVWNPEGNDARRREFWLWHVQESLPRIWSPLVKPSAG